jgi:LPS O-antigen subunit length determinant protein (WzzB/FepE family)
MTNNTELKTFNDSDEIDLRRLFEILWEGKNIIIGFILIFSIAAVFYSLSLPNIYQSSALLSPVSKNNSNQSLQGVGGLASLAGIDINQSAGGTEAKAIKKLNTLSFFTDSIYPFIYLPDLMAIESWNPSSNTIFYKNNLYNHKTKEWVRSFQYPKSQVPSPQESFKIFNKKHYNVSANENTGFVVISVKHQSPFLAKEWTKLIVNQVNDFFRAKDKKEAQAAMNFLNSQIAQTTHTEIKQVIAALLQQKMQQMTLIEANEFYVFSYLDPPKIMEEKIAPVRSSISILGAVIGLFLGAIFVIIRQYFRKTS